jgi:anti-anti-sigma factor
VTIFTGGIDPVLITLAGEFDMHNNDELRRAFGEFNEGDTVAVDLTDVTFFDSAAIGVLVAAAARKVRILITEMSDTVRRTFEITGVLDLFNQVLGDK